MNTNIVSEWSELIDRTDILILDTETTGIDGTAEIVQMSVIDTTGQEHLNEYIMPLGDIPPAASRVHGLTRQRLVELDARYWSEVFNDYNLLVSKADKVLVYNLDFDERMIRQSNKRNGIRHRKLPGRCIMLDYAAHRAVPGMYGEWKWHKLAAAARHEGSSFQQQDLHSALDDCHVVLGLMRAVCSRHR